jgi:hypothetical protein
MTPDPEKTLSSDEVRAIISICGKSRVAELKFGDLYVRFDTPVEQMKQMRGIYIPAADTTHLTSTDNEISAIQTNEAQQALERDEIALKEERLAQMFIENPLEAERLLVEGKLEDADGPEQYE